MSGLDPRGLLAHVHPDLVKVLQFTPQLAHPFVVVQGLRSVEDEKKAVLSKHSTTMHSRHLPDKNGWACAVDVAALVNGQVNWAPGNEATVFGHIAVEIKAAALLAHIPLEWGGDWIHFKDWGHFQLPWANYP